MPLPNSIQGTYTVRRNLEVLDNFKSGKVKANSIYGESLRNKDGIVTILDLDSQMPSLSIQKNKGKYTISLAETTYVFPLIDDEHDVRLVTDDTLLITEDGLSVKPETLLQPLYRAPDSRTVSLNIDDDELKVEDGKLTVIPYNYDFPLYREAESHTVGLQADDSLLITENGLSVNFPDPETLKKPLYRDQSGLGIKLHKSLKVNNNDELETNIQSVLKAFGALKSSSGADTLLDIGSSWLDFGFDSLTEMTDVLGEVDTTAIRLMVDSTSFSQAGSRLSLKSPGYEQIMYGNLTYGYSGSSSFTYSSTLQELRVPNVKLSGTLPAIGGGSYAVSKDYLSQFYQGSQTGAIAVSPEAAGRREIGCLDFNGVSIRPGTTNDVVLSLKCEAGSCLQMVKADTIKDVLTCSNGIERVQNDLQLDLKVDANSGLAMVNRGTIRDIFTASQGVSRVGNEFRLSLTAQSPDLTLNNGVLSSNIAAGIGLQKNGAILSTNLRGINGVQVSGNLISCSLTGSDTVLRVGDTLKGNYVGSTNSYGSVVVVGNTIQYNMIPPQFVSNSPNLIITGSYPLYNFTLIDPMPLSKQRDTDNTEQSDTAEVLKTDVPGGNVVVLSGATPLTTIPFPVMVSPPLTIPMAVNSILPIVSTFPWGMIFGGSRKRKVQRDAEGQPILDGDGNPVYKPIDPVTFMPPLEPGSNVAIASDPVGGCTRLLFDTPSCYRTIKYEYPQQAINLSMLRDYDTKLIKPWQAINLSMLRDYDTEVIKPWVTTGLASKQNLSPLLDNISSLTPADGTFLMGGNGGFFQIVPKDEILSAYQPLITPASVLNLSGLTVQNSNTNAMAITLGNTSAAQTWNIHVAGSSNGNLISGALGFYSSYQDKGYVFRIDPSGNTVVSGGLGVSTDAYVGGMLYIAGIEAATQKFVIDNIAPITQSLSSLTTTVTNNNNAVTTALASKQPMNATTNSLYTMTVQPDSWLYSSAGTTIENVTSNQVKGILDIATNAGVNTLLSGKQNNITTSTNLSLASVTANGYLSVQNAANPTFMSLVNTASNVTWGLRVAGSSADGSNPAGITQITNTSQSTSSTTGALLVSGGLGVAKDVYAGGNVISSTSVDAPNWVQSRNISSGTNAYAAIGCANDSGNGALLFLNSSTRTADGSSNNATLRNDCGDMNIQGKSGLGLGLRIVSISNEVKVLTTTDSSSATTGALQSIFAGVTDFLLVDYSKDNLGLLAGCVGVRTRNRSLQILSLGVGSDLRARGKESRLVVNRAGFRGFGTGDQAVEALC
ncbi:uncharacterized protein SPPG_08557 [Spizellomyces punctatus DAOM BR117]|uniref:Uncharacterized protein n=1 Tax=Spizellomyces punctatus (strain DAOM BR117) TaxID=645134 RepID=A0A0L0H4P8_SPIPD|nr:uncharacterized protein SPPG_08557 [Spizellomyces punctatus DAOM BR117]KNC96172.1 hypothetical protein SPPG_08557 [Spizellomyces punctatus DAOM BR117]|eukprot:XP_016604212.1 hypothetical protein SPPG_08557 [Spizellomyces punctatus DAOM BR117]